MNNSDSEEQKIIDQLLLENALEVVGIDDSNGEFLYSFTNKIKDVMPDLYEDHLNFVNSEIMTLWEKGYLDIDFLEENPTVRLTEKAVDKEELSKLKTQELWSLEEIKRLLKTPEV
jgi:hypothetical protein